MSYQSLDDDAFDADLDGDRTPVMVTFSLSTNKIRSTCTTTIDTGFERADWEEMSDYDKDVAMQEAFLDQAMHRLGGWDWEEVSS